MAQQPPPYAPAPGEKQGLYPQVPPDPQQQQPLQPQPGGYYPQQQPPVDPTAPPGQQAVTYYPPAGGQQHPQQLVIPQPAPVIVTQPRGYRPYVCHIIFSCCVFWCTGWGCCCGLIAFILASKLNISKFNISTLIRFLKNNPLSTMSPKPTGTAALLVVFRITRKSGNLGFANTIILLSRVQYGK